MGQLGSEGAPFETNAHGMYLGNPHPSAPWVGETAHPACRRRRPPCGLFSPSAAAAQRSPRRFIDTPDHMDLGTGAGSSTEREGVTEELPAVDHHRLAGDPTRGV